MMKSLFLLSLSTFSALANSTPYPITVRGSDDLSFIPKAPSNSTVIQDPTDYDAIVVGAGIAGLSSTVFLGQHSKKVLLIEKDEQLGGNSLGGTTTNGISFGRGAAYWAAPSEEQEQITKALGLNIYTDEYAIPEPSDSYVWKGKLYEEIWSAKTIKKLPSSFEVFYHELKMAQKNNLLSDIPMEESSSLLILDKLSGKDWISQMPIALSKRTDKKSKQVYKRFQNDKQLTAEAPMQDVLDFMDLYCRSALGTSCEQLSAALLASFYIGEAETRYTHPLSNGYLSKTMAEKIQSLSKWISVSTQSTATKIQHINNAVHVEFFKNGQTHKAKAKYLVYAAQLKFAPGIIEDLAKADPEKLAAIQKLQYAHYKVHSVQVKGHPYRNSYDTWLRADDYMPMDPTDVVLGRWMDPKIKAYKGLKDFKKNPADDNGIFTIYQPFFHPMDTTKRPKKNRSEHAEENAQMAVSRMIDLLTPVLHKGQKIEVLSVETSMWPFAMHVAHPGFLTELSPKLRKPLFGRIYFAHNNVGTPCMEEAMFRGHCAANNILKRMDDKFKPESWTKCRLE